MAVSLGRGVLKYCSQADRLARGHQCHRSIRDFWDFLALRLSMIWIKGFPATSDRAIDVVEREFTGVFFDATEKIARALLFVAIAMLCVSCRTDNRLGPSQATPIIYSSEMSAREDCLYREVARLLEPKGSPPTSLHNIAATATRFCSEAIRSRFQERSFRSGRAGPRKRGSSQDRTARLRDWPGAAREPDCRSGGQLRLWATEGSVSLHETMPGSDCDDAGAMQFTVMS